MGIFDALGSIFGPNISGPLTSGLNTGYNLANTALQGGLANVNQLYGQALPFLQSAYGQAAAPLTNLYQTGQTGVTQLQKLLGLGGGGPQGQEAALAGTPGYQFALDQGLGATRAGQAATGGTGSGAEATALQKYGTGLANQTYQSAVSNLSPFTNMFTSGASQLGNLFQGLGQQGANLFTGQAAAGTPFYQGLANLGWGYGTGTGAAGAQQNLVDASIGSNLVGNLLSAGTKLFSDPRLKTDVEPVGKLFDGSNIYKFRYYDDATPRIGLMADEVALRTPDAVSEHPSGFKMVDYGKAVERSASIFDAFMKAA